MRTKMSRTSTVVKKAAVMLIVLLATASVLNVEAQVSRRQAKKDFQVTWLGHAAFEIVSPGGTLILIDPFLNQNPSTPSQFKDLERYQPE